MEHVQHTVSEVKQMETIILQSILFFIYIFEDVDLDTFPTLQQYPYLHICRSIKKLLLMTFTNIIRTTNILGSLLHLRLLGPIMNFFNGMSLRDGIFCSTCSFLRDCSTLHLIIAHILCNNDKNKSSQILF